jgi:hypothetical protein
MSEVSKHEERLNIRCTAESKQIFVGLSEESNTDYGTVLDTLLHAYKQVNGHAPIEIQPNHVLGLLTYTPSQREEIDRACSHEYSDFWQILQIGVLAQARRINSGSVHIREGNQCENFENSRARKGKRGSAFLNVAQTVARLMKTNSTATNQWEVVYLSKMLIKQEAHAHMSSVHEYYAVHGDDIERHNQENGFGSEQAGQLHNRRRAEYMRQQRQEMVNGHK